VSRGRGTGVAVGLGVLALVAVPAVVTAAFALASLTWSDPPEPAVGALWAGITLLLLALPLAAGLVTAREPAAPGSTGPARRWLPSACAAVVLLVAWQLLRRVV
jgi:threonine/homoserine/homoserine lactone efflux protein